MISAYGPLNNTGIAKAFTLNVKALAALDHVSVLEPEESQTGDVLFVQSTASELRRISKTRLFRHYRVRIAYFVWETECVPKETAETLKHYTHVWTASEYCQKALAAAGVESTVIPHCVVSYSYNPEPDGIFRFLTIFDSHSRILRKNPFDVVKAFQGAFGARRDVQLTVKARNLSQEFAQILKNSAPTANIKLLNDDATNDEIEQLYSDHDAFISLHQAEGFGLTVLEAMAHGMPVVYTDYSAPTEFAYGLPVAYDKRPSQDSFYEGHLVAFPRLKRAEDQLKQALSFTQSDRRKAFQQSLNYSFAQLLTKISNAYFNL